MSDGPASVARCHVNYLQPVFSRELEEEGWVVSGSPAVGSAGTVSECTGLLRAASLLKGSVMVTLGWRSQSTDLGRLLPLWRLRSCSSCD